MKNILLLVPREIDKWLCLHVHPTRLRYWWHTLWVRKNEFHPSLDVDTRIEEWLRKKGNNGYMKDLLKRRQIAHENDLQIT